MEKSLSAARLEGWQAATDALRVALNLTPAQIAHAEAIERNRKPEPQDMMLDELIEPTLYAVLKQYGFSTARSQNGVYYDERSHACYEAWMAGRNSTKPKFSA